MGVNAGRWTPSIGDPTIIGWVTVVVYFIVASICLKAALKAKLDSDKTIKNLWLFLTVFLIALGINNNLIYKLYLPKLVEISLLNKDGTRIGERFK